MFEVKEEVQEALEQLWSATVSAPRGHVIRWETIEGAVGCSRTSGRGAHVIRKWRARLRKERGLVLRPVPGVGFLVLSKEKHLVVPFDERSRKAMRQAGKAIAEIEALAAAGLSVHQQRSRALQLGALRGIRKEARAWRRKWNGLKPPESMPRRQHLVPA